MTADSNRGAIAFLKLRLGLISSWFKQRSGALRVATLVVAYVALSAWDLLTESYPPGTRAVGFAALSLVSVLGLLRYVATATGTGAITALFQGQDQRISTSKVQYLLWMFGLLIALSYIGGYSLASGNPFVCKSQDFGCVVGSSWDQYVLLLSVPAGAAVLAKGIVSAKVQNGTLQKTDAHTSSVSDIVTDDAGRADFVDIQYLIFNLITFAYVAVTFAQAAVLKDVPSVLLGLTSTSAGTYVANKALQVDRPTISSVTPSVLSPGLAVTIRGTNFIAAGGPQSAAVTVGGQDAGDPTRVSPGVIECRAPFGMSSASATVVVTTAAQVATAPYSVVIAPFAIVSCPSQIAADAKDPLTIYATGVPIAQQSGQCSMLVAQHLYAANVSTDLTSGLSQLVSDNTVRDFKLTPGDNVQISIFASGARSDSRLMQVI